MTEYGNQNAVAKAIGVDRSRVRQMIRDGILPRFPPGQFPLEECVQIYQDYMATSERIPPSRAAMITVGEERRRKMAADANERELRYLQRAGELVPAAELQQLWAEAGATVRERILQAAERIGTELGPYIAPEHELAVRNIVLAEIEKALTTISEGAPNVR